MDEPGDELPGAGPEAEAEWLRQQIVVFQQRLDALEGREAAPTGRTAPPPSAGPAPPTMPPPTVPAPPALPAPPTVPAPPALPAPPTVPAPPTMPAPPTVPASSSAPTSPPSPAMPPPPAGPAMPAPSAVRPPAGSRERTPVTLPGIESMLKWAGLVLLFLSALFLVSTAIQRGWIGPELQLLGAAAIGVALIAGGLVLGRRRSGWDVPLVGVGIAVLSASATAGWQWLELWSREPWIGISFVVLAISVALTGHLRSPGVGTTGLITTAGSMAVLSDSIPQAAVLLAVVIATGEATSVWRRSASLHLMTVAVGLVSFGSLAAVAYAEDEPTSIAMLSSGAVVTLMFWVMPLVFSARGTEPSPLGVDWRPTVDRLVISLPALFALAWTWSSDLGEDRSGLVFLTSGGIALACSAAVGASRRFGRSIWVSELMGGAAAVTLGWVLLFEGPGVLAGLTAQTAALLVFIRLIPDRWAVFQAGAMAVIAGALALAGMIEAIDVDAPVVDDLVHLAVVALLAGWAWWEVRSNEQGKLGSLLGGAAFAGAALWPVSALIHVPQGQALISFLWAALGFALLALAFVRSSIRLAWASVLTLGVVMVKLLTVDLAEVDTFWRVALFLVLGGAFLFASFRVGTAIRVLSSDRTDRATHEGDEGPETESGADDQGPDQDSGLAFQK